MNKAQYIIMVVLAIVAGLVGGAISGEFFMGKSTPHGSSIEKLIRAEAFELVDEKGNAYAELKRVGEGVQLKMLDASGSEATLWVNHSFGSSTAGLNLANQGGHALELKARADETVLDLFGVKDSGIRLSATKYGPSMHLSNEEGRVLWSAPGKQRRQRRSDVIRRRDMTKKSLVFKRPRMKVDTLKSNSVSQMNQKMKVDKLEGTSRF